MCTLIHHKSVEKSSGAMRIFKRLAFARTGVHLIQIFILPV